MLDHQCPHWRMKTKKKAWSQLCHTAGTWQGERTCLYTFLERWANAHWELHNNIEYCKTGPIYSSQGNSKFLFFPKWCDIFFYLCFKFDIVFLVAHFTRMAGLREKEREWKRGGEERERLITCPLDNFKWSERETEVTIFWKSDITSLIKSKTLHWFFVRIQWTVPSR